MGSFTFLHPSKHLSWLFFFGFLVLRVVGRLVVGFVVTGFLVVVSGFIFTFVMLPEGAITRIFSGYEIPEAFLFNPFSNRLGSAVVVIQPPVDKPKVDEGVTVTLELESVDIGKGKGVVDNHVVGRGVVVEKDDIGIARVVEKASEVRGGKGTVVGVDSRIVTSDIPGPEGGEEGGKDGFDCCACW